MPHEGPRGLKPPRDEDGPEAGAVRTAGLAVEPIDPTSYALAILSVLAAVATACAVPAMRAAGINPVEALRHS